MIRTENVYKNFELGNNTVEVLKDVSIKVEQGEFVSIMGPSGSGKSTLLYLLGGLDFPTSGEIHIKNKKLSEMKDHQASILRRREVGFVFQFYNLVANLNVEDNILLPSLLDGKKIKDVKKSLDNIYFE